MEQHYDGCCHCGAVQYEADLDLEKGTIRCNCSRCSKSRAWLAFTPVDKLQLKSGDDQSFQYRWTPPNRQRAEPDLSHLFNLRDTYPRGRNGPKGQHTVAVQSATLEGPDPDILAKSAHYVDGRHNRFDREPEHSDAL